MGGPGRPFKPGQTGNAKGRPKLSSDVKRVRSLTGEQLKAIGDVLLLGNKERLEEILNSPRSNLLDIWLASVAKKGISKGDMYSLNELLNRLVGKVTDKVEHKLPQPTIIKRSDGTELELGAKVKEDKDHDS